MGVKLLPLDRDVDLQDVNKRRKDRRIGVADRRTGTTELLAIKGV